MFPTKSLGSETLADFITRFHIKRTSSSHAVDDSLKPSTRKKKEMNQFVCSILDTSHDMFKLSHIIHTLRNNRQS